MYKYFVRSELKNNTNPSDQAKAVKMNQEMGFIGNIDAARQKLEELFDNNKDS